MTRFGMKEKEMEVIAELFKKCLIDGKYVGDQVKEFRGHFQNVQYSFDQSAEEV
jgi:glycine hydroxymethyltransferase